MTLQEYYATPESVLPRELILGVLRAADAPFVPHQRVVLKLALALQQHAGEYGGEVLVAPVDVVLDPGRALVLQPDLLYVSAERAPIVLDRVNGAPDLVIEVLSPHPRIGKLEERVRWFAEYGVREIWLYNQITRRLDVLSCGGRTIRSSVSFDSRAAVRSAVLPHFDRTLGSILAGPGW